MIKPSVTVSHIICASYLSPAVPAPMASITTSRSAPLYAGTSFSLTCDFSFHPSVDTTQDTAIRWRVNGTAVDSSPDRISTLEESLGYSPLAISDSGSYMCEVTITAQEYTTVEGMTESVPVEITVEGILYTFHFHFGP